MSQSLALTDPALLALLHGSFGGGALAPFAREILLAECQVAGTSFRDWHAIEPTLEPGALLALKREPGNAHDALAIMILSADGTHLGYVPRAKNEVLARLMDAGKPLFARLRSKARQGNWLQAEMQVFLRDF